MYSPKLELEETESCRLDRLALKWADEDEGEWAWVLRGIVDAHDGLDHPYTAPELYRTEYNYGKTASRFDPQALTAVEDYLRAGGLVDEYHLIQALGYLVDLADGNVQ